MGYKQLIAMGSITHEVKRLIWQNFSFKDVWLPHARGTESWHTMMEKNRHVLQRKQNIGMFSKGLNAATTACTDVPAARNDFPAQKASQPGNKQACMRP